MAVPPATIAAQPARAVNAGKRDRGRRQNVAKWHSSRLPDGRLQVNLPAETYEAGDTEVAVWVI
jgi:hypothetical protein